MLSVGQRLKEARVKKGLTLEDVAKATKIRMSFLSALENGEYGKLPSSAYAAGFVGNYADFLGFPREKILAIFRREYDENAVFRVLPQGLTSSSNNFFSTIKIEQTVFLILFLFLLLAGYVMFQYRFALFSPTLSVTKPIDKAVMSSQTIEVVGKTSPHTIVTVNDLPVNVTDTGDFSKKIDVFIGKSTIKIKAANRFGKQTIIERHIEVK